MHPSQIPEKPLIVSPNKAIEPAKEIYFLEKENGQIVHTDERDAWNLLQGRNQIVGRRQERIKLIGVSDGVGYQQVIKESHELLKTAGLEAAQARLRKGIADELEKSRGIIKMPRNWDATGPGGVRVDLNLLR